MNGLLDRVQGGRVPPIPNESKTRLQRPQFLLLHLLLSVACVSELTIGPPRLASRLERRPSCIFERGSLVDLLDLELFAFSLFMVGGLCLVKSWVFDGESAHFDESGVFKGGPSRGFNE